MTTDVDAIRYMLGLVTDDMNDVKIYIELFSDSTTEDLKTKYYVIVPEKERGKAIGRGGEVIGAIRKILQTKATKEGHRLVYLEIVTDVAKFINSHRGSPAY